MDRLAQIEPQEVYDDRYDVGRLVEKMNRSVRLDTIFNKPWLATAKRTIEKKKNKEI